MFVPFRFNVENLISWHRSIFHKHVLDLHTKNVLLDTMSMEKLQETRFESDRDLISTFIRCKTLCLSPTHTSRSLSSILKPLCTTYNNMLYT